MKTHTRFVPLISLILLASAPEMRAVLGCEEGKIYSADELATLDRENSWWRTVRPQDDLETNLTTLRRAGFSEAELGCWSSELNRLWSVELERHYGWLQPEKVREIQDIDRRFTIRMRAARLWEATGMRSLEGPSESVRQVDAQWHWAILKALDYDEIAEFRLMNSQIARKVGEWTKELYLTEGERRTVDEWQGEYESALGPAATKHGHRSERWEQDKQRELWERLRDFLGDGRFVEYLDRADPRFHSMRAALRQGPQVSDTNILNLWWVRLESFQARENRPSVQVQSQLIAAARAKAEALLGASALAHYAENEDGRWLRPLEIHAPKGPYDPTFRPPSQP